VPSLFPGALLVFVRAVPADLRSRVAASGVWEPENKPDSFYRPWGRTWVTNLARLRSRLPPTLDPDVMAGILAPYLDEPDEVGESALVCTNCGLTRPVLSYKPRPAYRPEFFATCPGCGHKPANWDHLIVEGQYDWQRLALAELAAAAPDPCDRGPP
jgi:hypothetical protein